MAGAINAARVTIDVNSNAQGATAQLSGLDRELRTLDRDLNKTSNGVNNLNNRLNQTQGGARGFASNMGMASAAIGAFMGLQIVQFVGRIGMAMVQGAAQMEMYRANFETMLGSAEAGAQMLERVRDMAAATPFGTTDLVGATETLLQFGMAGEEVIPTLRMLGDISLGDANKLSRLSLVMGQVAAAGRMTGQDLLQMINAGFNPLQELVRTQGHDIAYWREQMENGRITTQMVTDAMRSATAEGGRFHDGMARGAQTLSGKWSTLKDNVMNLAIAIGEQLTPALTEMVDGVNQVFDAFSGSETYFFNFEKGIRNLTRAIGDFLPSLQDIVDRLDEINQAQNELEALNVNLGGGPPAGGTAPRRRRPGGGPSGGTQPGGMTIAGADANAMLEQFEQYKTMMAAKAQAEREAEAARVKLAQETWNGILQIASTTLSGIQNLLNMQTSNELSEEEKKYKKKKEWINKNVKDEATRKKKLEEADEEYEKKVAQLKRKSAKESKALNLMNAIVQTAAGITSALAMSGPPWVGIAMAAIVGAMGAAQIALIASTPIPEAKYGGDFTVPPGYSADSALLRVNSGEDVSVTPERQSGNTGNVYIDIDGESMRGYVRNEVNRIMNDGSVQIRRKGVVKYA